MVRDIDIFYAIKLSKLRGLCNLKQYAAASLLKIRQQQYSDLESGKLCFTPAMIRSIYDVFSEYPNTKLSSTLEWFSVSIFNRLSLQQNQDVVFKVIELYYLRESLNERLAEVERSLKKYWQAISREQEYPKGDFLIHIAGIYNRAS